jgi:hypothetical protein
MSGRAKQGSFESTAMNSALALLFSAALYAVPALDVDASAAALVPAEEREMQAGLPGDMAEVGADVWEELSDAFRVEPQEQVRIERRVIVRISPRMPLQTEGAAGSAATTAPRRFEERRMGKCVSIKGISGVQISPQDRLLLFMRDHHIVSVRLQKSCSARDFYSGFYVENSPDGMICAGRDTLHSRAGVNCEVAKLHRLVPDD